MGISMKLSLIHIYVGQAIDLINRQKGGGGTELAPALEKAAGIPMDPRAGTVSRSIVVITDG